jgi:long-chain acyl-CoA synthetase
MLSFLLADPRVDEIDWSSLRWLVSGGAALPIEVAASFERRTGVRILQGYGLTETSPTISLMRMSDPPKPGSCGRPVDGCEVRIVDDTGASLPASETGEVVCRGPNVMLGYRGLPAETATAISPDGWFSTGDLGHLDAEGFLFITDRKKDLIIRGGLNIIPRDVEEVLHEHPAVAQAAVVGARHPELGEEVIAFVVPVAGTDVDEQTLIAHCQAALAKYKTPRRIIFRDALPMNGIGKILRRELREEASAFIAEG